MGTINGMGTGVEHVAVAKGVTLAKPQRATFAFGMAIFEGAIIESHAQWIMVRVECGSYADGELITSGWLIGRDLPVNRDDAELI